MAEYNRAIKPRHVCLKLVDKDDDEVPLTVKSIEELEIANFLYLKGIEFIYEDKYVGPLPKQWESWDDDPRGYRPDFHLIKKKNRLYLKFLQYSYFLQYQLPQQLLMPRLSYL